MTLSGFESDGTPVTPRTVRFNLAGNTNTQMMHKDIIDRTDADLGHFQATHIQIKLVANSGAGGVPAPKIHSVKLTTNGRARVAKTRAAS